MIQHKKRYPSSFDYCYKVTAMLCAMMVVSCSSDSDTVMVDEGKPISFSLDNESQARAIVNSFKEFTANNFGVTAYWYDGDITKIPQVAIDNQKINVSGSTCTVEGNYKYYWTKGTWHFSAYSPWVEDPANAPVQVTTPSSIYGGYTFSGTVDGETDYMFADEQPGYYEMTGSNNLQIFDGNAVPMTFRHALTKVTFGVRLTDADGGNNKVTFNSVGLSKVRNSGKVAFKHLGNALTSPNDRNRWYTCNPDDGGRTEDKWSVDDSKKAGYQIPIDTPIEITDEAEHELDKVFYLLPQALLESGDDAQTINVSYTLQIGNSTTTHNVSIPIRSASIEQWSTNTHVHYTLNVNPPGGTASLSVSVQPWELEAFENEFSSTVSVNNEGKIRWTEDTYNKIDGDIVVLKDDITSPAEFKFTIASPLGGTWKAFFVTQSGNPNAFTLTPSEGPVGKECTVTVAATEENQSNTANQAELRFVVIQAGQILPVDILTTLGDNHNYKILQNINK